MNTSPNTARIPLICALGALTAWSLKSVAIGLAGGLGKSPWEGPFFLIGLALALAAAVGTGLVLTAGRHPVVRLGAGLLGAVAGLAGAGLVDGVARSLVDSDLWVWSELNLWVLAVVLVGVTWWTGRGQHSAPGRRVLVEDLA